MLKWLAQLLRLTQPQQRYTEGKTWPTYSNSGPYISEDAAYKVATFYACVRVIASNISQIPWHVYKGTREGASEIAYDHPVDRLLNSAPTTDMEAATWRELMIQWVMTWGNAYCEIERDRSFRPIALWPIQPWRVRPWLDANNQKRFTVTNSIGESIATYANDQILHFRNLGEELEGWSVIRYAANTLGLGLSQETSMASQMREGSRISGVMSPAGNMTIPPEKLKTYSKMFNEQVAGADKHGRMLFTNAGFTFHDVTMNNSDAQLLESRKFTVPEICRFCGVPPHKVYEMERATFNNIEHQSIEFVTDTIVPWATKFEQQADRRLISRPRQYYTKLNTTALVRGDMAARTNYYNGLWNLGALSANEIRAAEDLNPVEGGDKHFVPLNMQLLEDAGEEPEPMADPFQTETDIEAETEEDGNGRFTRIRRD